MNPVFKPTLPLALVLANKLINQLDFSKHINKHLKTSEEIQPADAGMLLKALILSTFVDMRAPLAYVSERLKPFDIEYLLDKKGIEPDAFNIGQALEHIGEAGPGALYESLAIEAIIINGIPIKRLHPVKTAVSFREECDIDTMRLTETEDGGFRPDCAQIVGQVVNEIGIPVISRALESSVSDEAWSKQALTHIKSLSVDLNGKYVPDITIANKGKPFIENSIMSLKEPWPASIVYLKNQSRVKGLILALSLVFLIRGIIQFQLRHGLETYKYKNKGKLPNLDWDKKQLNKPAYDMFYKNVEDCCYIREKFDTYSLYWRDDAKEGQVNTLLQLLGYSVIELLDRFVYEY